MTVKKNGKITTIKLRLETKERLDNLKEFDKETYDEIIKKILYILNTLRTNPEVAHGILRNIDSKMKRNQQVNTGILKEKPRTQEKQPEKQERKSENKPAGKIQKFIPRKILR